MNTFVRVSDFYPSVRREKPKKPRVSARDRERAERERTNKQLREEIAAERSAELAPAREIKTAPRTWWLETHQSELPLFENS